MVCGSYQEHATAIFSRCVPCINLTPVIPVHPVASIALGISEWGSVLWATSSLQNGPETV